MSDWENRTELEKSLELWKDGTWSIFEANPYDFEEGMTDGASSTIEILHKYITPSLYVYDKASGTTGLAEELSYQHKRYFKNKRILLDIGDSDLEKALKEYWEENWNDLQKTYESKYVETKENSYIRGILNAIDGMVQILRHHQVIT